MRYTTILFDLDDTLYDSAPSADLAFADALGLAGIDDTEPYWPTFHDINVAMWGEVEAGTLTPTEVRNGRFERLVTEAGIDADPIVLADRYTWGLGNYGDLYPGALELLEELAEHATLALVTNGIGEVQRSRVHRFDLERFFDAIVISGETGVSKPGSEIFDLTFGRLGKPDKASTLIIGDSLTSDMAGGIAYGIDTCWYDTRQRSPDGVPCTYHVEGYEEIPPIVAGTFPNPGGSS